MTQQSQQRGAVDNEFDGAKAIVETLKRLDKGKQERAMRARMGTARQSQGAEGLPKVQECVLGYASTE